MKARTAAKETIAPKVSKLSHTSLIELLLTIADGCIRPPKRANSN